MFISALACLPDMVSPRLAQFWRVFGYEPRTIARRRCHFSCLWPGDSLLTSLTRHEHYLFGQLHLKPGGKVLLIGGSLDIAKELYEFTGAWVTFLEYNDSNVSNPDTSTTRSTIGPVGVEVMRGDVLEVITGLPTDYFDAICSVETLKASGDGFEIYRRIPRVIKTGGTFAIYEWCLTSAFNMNDMAHMRYAELLQQATGIRSCNASDYTIDANIAFLRAAGFSIVRCEDLEGRKGCLPWYQVLSQMMMTGSYRSEDIDLPCYGRFQNLTRSSASVLLEAGRHKIFSPLVLIVATAK